MVIDYGAGNLRSVVNAFARVGCMLEVTGDPDVVRNANAVVFPGVGAGPAAMRSLRERGLDDAIREFVKSGRPLFAVCVGMQVLFDTTGEGGRHECLGILPGEVRRLPDGLTVPHMGWNQVDIGVNHPVMDGVPDGTDFYFVHSYYCVPESQSHTAGLTDYGVRFCSMATRDNLIATQFHPEKSGEYGLRMYANFLKMTGSQESVLRA